MATPHAIETARQRTVRALTWIVILGIAAAFWLTVSSILLARFF